MLLSVFTGFGIVIPILKLIRTSDLRTLEVKDLFVLTAVQAVRIAGILFFLLWAIQAFITYTDELSQEVVVNSVQSNLFGSYWWVDWYQPLMYLLLSQLFWIKKLYLRKPALITLALLMLFLPSKRIMFMVTNPGEDHLSMLLPQAGTLALELLLNIIVFTFITFAIMLAGGKLRKKQ